MPLSIYLTTLKFYASPAGDTVLCPEVGEFPILISSVNIIAEVIPSNLDIVNVNNAIQGHLGAALPLWHIYYR